MWKPKSSTKASGMNATKLRKGDPITLLPSGEQVRVRSVSKNHFLVTDHMLGIPLADEYHPIENPAGSWARPEHRKANRMGSIVGRTV